MKKAVSTLIISLLVISLVACGGTQTSSDDNGISPEGKGITRLLLGTSSVGGTYYALGGGWAGIMNDKMSGIDISVEVTGGPTTNIQLIEDKQMELGLATTWLAGEGFNGEGWSENQKYDSIRALFPVYKSILYAYSLEGKGIDAIGDFNEKNVSVGAPGATSDAAGRAVLEILEIDAKKIDSLPTNTAINGIKDGIVDGGFLVSGVPAPALLDLETTHQIKHLGLTQEEINKILNSYPYWAQDIIKKGTYKDLNEDINVISFWNIAIGDKELSEDLVYDIVKTTFENYDALVAVDPSAADCIPDNIKYSSIPLHKGAIRYYEEIGIEIPSNLLPPEAK
ncbi:TAXI family TRAP transporter solute-binding subunit [Clostridium formicaceticum]|uniref:TAXI family TRAP transporter solute-binding subunit n=1 Tax=Clostridium formicaceticum TaxID=1497 RepID=A0AAC9RJ06_9CLOT|nr:TAXI family TRAP transporter solute-binding subunit [Clostridium formicaceticum]AOY76538.1 hypothetical protein BJL90_12110 [Clostridium formicaceticum]ARE86951.1 hypothetical protein CLFO_13350 [Clostridium formicaceticum]